MPFTHHMSSPLAFSSPTSTSQTINFSHCIFLIVFFLLILSFVTLLLLSFAVLLSPPFILVKAFIARLIPFLKHIKTSMGLTFPTSFPIHNPGQMRWIFLLCLLLMFLCLQVLKPVVSLDFTPADFTVNKFNSKVINNFFMSG